MGTRQPAMSTARWGHSDWNIQTPPWVKGSSYLRSPRLSWLKQNLANLFLWSERRVLQRLWQRHCHCEHLLWRLNGIWWGILPHYNSNPSTNVALQSLKGHQRWLGWTSLLALAASVAFVSESALCRLLRFSTGFLSGFAGTSDPSPG